MSHVVRLDGGLTPADQGRVDAFVRELRQLMFKYGLSASLFGHVLTVRRMEGAFMPMRPMASVKPKKAKSPWGPLAKKTWFDKAVDPVAEKIEEATDEIRKELEKSTNEILTDAKDLLLKEVAKAAKDEVKDFVKEAVGLNKVDELKDKIKDEATKSIKKFVGF